jgi:hypothetical protein
MKKLNFYSEPRNYVSTEPEVFNRFYEYCKQAMTDVEITHINSKTFQAMDWWQGPGCKYGWPFLIIENPETSKYILVSYWEKLKNVVIEYEGTFWDIENCLEIITSIGVHTEDRFYKPLPHRYTPFSFLTSVIENERYIEEIYAAQGPKQIFEIPKFRGALYLFREALLSDPRFDIISRGSLETNLTPRQYMEELYTSKVSISLNGAGEVCYRDMEIMGLGNVLIRQEWVAQFHNPIIPYVHYIPVPFQDIPTDIPHDEYWKILADRFHEVYQTTINDPDLIQYVSENARQWYLENGTVDANVNLLKQLVNFDLLFP